MSKEYIIFYDIPTPTPWPSPEATLPFEIDSDDYYTSIGMYSVQLWNSGNSNGLLTDIQVAILIIIVIVFIGGIFKAIQNL